MSAYDPTDGFNNFYPIDGSSYRGGLFGLNSAKAFFRLDNEYAHLKAYNECPPLKSIIAKRAMTFNMGIIEIVNNTSLLKATSTEANNLRAILKKPNVLQTQRQFMTQHNTYIDIFGYCPVFIVKPFGRPDSITGIWNIPPWLFDLRYGNNFIYATQVTDIFTSFKMKWTGGDIDLPTENLKIIFDDGFGTDDNMNLTIPNSRLHGQEYPVCNIIASLKGRNTLLTSKGAIGILSNRASDSVGHIPLLESERDRVQNDFKRYGITGHEYQVIVTDANLQWQQMGYPTKELMLFEEIEDDVNHLCDAYGWPTELMANRVGVTYLNKDAAERAVITRTIMPESQSRLEQLTERLVSPNANISIVRDYSHLEVLQEDKLLSAKVRQTKSTTAEKEFKNNVITLNEWSVLIGQDERTDGAGDKYYYQLLDEGWTFGTTTTQTDQPTTDNQNTTA